MTKNNFYKKLQFCKVGTILKGVGHPRTKFSMFLAFFKMINIVLKNDTYILKQIV